MVAAYYLDADDRPTIVVNRAAGVLATEGQMDQLTTLLTQSLDARRMHNVADGDARQCEVHVTLTRFQKGGKPTHVLLASQGQIHLDASVTVIPVGGGERLNAFNISKTFSWNGINGAYERIEDIEPAFADGIAAALTGQSAEADNAAAAK